MEKLKLFLKSNTAHKLFGVALGALSTYLLTVHVDLSAVLKALGISN